LEFIIHTVKTRLAAAALALVPALASAHHFMGEEVPRTFAQGLLSGLAHPVIGLDHAAFIVAAGFLLALFRHGLWGIAALVAGSLLGAALHLKGVPLPGVEAGVALSVVLIGALLMVKREIGLAWLAGILLVAGALHGFAYAESIFGAQPAPLAAYLAGFSIIQFALASASYFVHWRFKAARELAFPLGAAAGAVGLIFLVV
jgi:urease accessory protein